MEWITIKFIIRCDDWNVLDFGLNRNDTCSFMDSAERRVISMWQFELKSEHYKHTQLLRLIKRFKPILISITDRHKNGIYR